MSMLDCVGGGVVYVQYLRAFQQFGDVACKVQTSQVVSLTPPIWHLLKVHFEGREKCCSFKGQS